MHYGPLGEWTARSSGDCGAVRCPEYYYARTEQNVQEPNSPSRDGREAWSQGDILGGWLSVLPRQSLCMGSPLGRGQGIQWSLLASLPAPLDSQGLRTYPVRVPLGASPGGAHSIRDLGRRPGKAREPTQPGSSTGRDRVLRARVVPPPSPQADSHRRGLLLGSVSSRKE